VNAELKIKRYIKKTNKVLNKVKKIESQLSEITGNNDVICEDFDRINLSLRALKTDLYAICDLIAYDREFGEE